MTTQTEHQEKAFKAASAIVQGQYSHEVIQRKWNASHLGEHAQLSTIQRWLNVGPNTKNPRFEPWIVGLAAQFL